MVKLREQDHGTLSATDRAAKAEKWGNEAIPKVPRRKPYKAINIPFKTEADYLEMVAAAKAADRKPTDFLKAAITDAIRRQLKKDTD